MKMKALMRLIGISLALLLLFTASACNTAQAEEVDLLIEKEDEKVFEETKEKSLSKMQDLAGLVLQFTDEDTLVLKQNDSVLKVEYLQKDVCAFFSKTSSSILPNIKQPDFSTLWGWLLGKEISKHAAVKAMYVTKQMNLTLMQNEMILGKMSANEKGYAVKKQQSENRIENYKAEVEKIMGEISYEQ